MTKMPLVYVEGRSMVGCEMVKEEREREECGTPKRDLGKKKLWLIVGSLSLSKRAFKKGSVCIIGRGNREFRVA